MANLYVTNLNSTNLTSTNTSASSLMITGATSISDIITTNSTITNLIVSGTSRLQGGTTMTDLLTTNTSSASLNVSGNSVLGTCTMSTLRISSVIEYDTRPYVYLRLTSDVIMPSNNSSNIAFKSTTSSLIESSSNYASYFERDDTGLKILKTGVYSVSAIATIADHADTHEIQVWIRRSNTSFNGTFLYGFTAFPNVSGLGNISQCTSHPNVPFTANTYAHIGYYNTRATSVTIVGSARTTLCITKL